MRLAIFVIVCAALCIAANAEIMALSIVLAVNHLITTNFVKIAAGDFHSVLLRTDLSVATTGVNYYGQLGDGTHADRNQFEEVLSGRVVAVAAGMCHTVVLKQDGSVWTTGCNSRGQLGDRTYRSKNDFTRVMSGGGTAVAVGMTHTMVLKEDGTVWCTGDNFYGQLADGNRNGRRGRFTRIEYSTSGSIQTQYGVIAMAAGSHHSLVLKQDGTLWATGRNNRGQLGDGTKLGRARFVYVKPFVKDIAAGAHHSLIIKQDGSVWSAGCNKYGQLGQRYVTHSSTFVRTSYSLVAVAVAAGSFHSLVLSQDTSLWVVGLNNQGQLGDGTTNSWRYLKKVISSGVVAMAGGLYHTLVAKKNGNVLAAGWNKYGQFGNGYRKSKSNFVQVAQIGYTKHDDNKNNSSSSSSSNNYMTRNLMLPYSDVATASTFEHINYICIFS